MTSTTYPVWTPSPDGAKVPFIRLHDAAGVIWARVRLDHINSFIFRCDAESRLRERQRVAGNGVDLDFAMVVNGAEWNVVVEPRPRVIENYRKQITTTEPTATSPELRELIDRHEALQRLGQHIEAYWRGY